MGESLLPALQWSGGLLALHLIFYRAAKRVGGDIGAAPHLAGHFPVALTSFSILAVIGTMKWLSHAPTDRLHGYSADGVFIARFMLAFQLYELIAITFDWKLAGPGTVMVMHHVLVVVLSAWVVTHQYMHYYCIFFFGVPEISSVPLAFVDLFKQVPALRARFPMLNQVRSPRFRANSAALVVSSTYLHPTIRSTQIARNSFAVSFILVRIFWFSLVSFHFWQDSLVELRAPIQRQPIALVITVCAVNIVMVGLQYYWGSLVIRVRRLHLRVGVADAGGPAWRAFTSGLPHARFPASTTPSLVRAQAVIKMIKGDASHKDA